MSKQTIMLDDIIDSKRGDVPLHSSVKETMQKLINILQDLYDEKVGQDGATEMDALEFIPLFCIHGALLASVLGVTYEEYLMVCDYYIMALGLEEEQSDDEE